MTMIPITTLPRVLPPQRDRAPQATIPQTRDERESLRQFISGYVNSRREAIVPPLVLDQLRTHAEAVIALTGVDRKFTDYAGVLVSNEVWREQLATVPYERRLLLLPKCLRVEDKCPAPFDEFGLLCKQCGLCTIQDLQEEAEKLGYAVLVAEGSAIVMSLIQTGKIDAIVGVSCLSVLERAFPYMESAAVPGVAIPLLQDDCKDTTVDIEWIWEVLHLTSDDRTRRLDLDALRREVDSWFTTPSLDALFGGAPASPSEHIARGWLAAAGKRWRPFLTACAWQALQDDAGHDQPRACGDAVRKAAVAVECFHKASLIHDDIEDNDPSRYGEPTLHARHGMPLALNVGDLLIGEGYRLLAECQVPAEVRVQLLKIAAEGQRTLCLGQGAELEWSRAPAPLPATAVVDIFRRKTAPAFEVALRIGAALAGADDDVHDTLAKYSEALGIAYQIRDDLADLDATDGNDIGAGRPTLPLALAYEKAKGEDRTFLEQVWRRGGATDDHPRTRALIAAAGEARARALLDAYKEQAVRTLTTVDHAGLKGLLRRVVGKIFSVEIKGWCGEFEARNAAGRAAVAQSAG